MLILENLSLQAAKKSFLNGTQKFLKLCVNGQIVTTKQPGRVRSPTLIEWTEPISLPLFINVEYTFQIFQKHSFGFNPQQLNQIVGGKIIVEDHDTFNNWEVLNQKNQKYGFLSANIRKKLRYSPNASTAPPEEQILSISSIIAHLNALKQKRAFVQLKLHNKVYKTQYAKSKAGELLFTDALEIQKTDQMNDLEIEIFQYDAKEEKSQKIGSGFLKMDPQHPEKRAVIKDSKNMQIGQVFIDFKVTPKQLYTASKQLTKIIHKSSMLSRSIEPFDRVNNSSLAQSIISGNDSMLSRSRRSAVKPSIVHPNTNIFTPTEPRFQKYIDRQNQNVSYIRQQKRDFDFKDKHSNLYYKGASIGKGQKYNFTHVYRSNPGVGVYNLPCIWDRY